jgi:Transglycosylase SLT domain
MVDYIRDNLADDAYNQRTAQLTGSRIAEQDRARMMGTDAAIRRGLRRITAPSAGSVPSASMLAGDSMQLPTGGLSGGVTPTPLPGPANVQPTLGSTADQDALIGGDLGQSPPPMAGAQPMGYGAGASAVPGPGQAGMTAALGGNGMPPVLSGPMNRPPTPAAPGDVSADPYFSGIANGLSNAFGGTTPSPQPTGYDNLDSAYPGLSGGQGADQVQGGAGVDLLSGVESGRRQADANGNLLRSSAGAVGSMQVMPSTGPEAAAAAGVPWDEALFYDPGPAGQAYNEVIGDGYFNKLLAHYNGDKVKAAGAYNAGPARMDEFLNTGRPLPLETQQYIQKVFGGQGGGMPTPGAGAPGRSGLRQIVADMPSGQQQYGPILQELANVPGGGEVALKLLQNGYQQDSQISQDRLRLEGGFQNDEDQMERFALTALASGDTDVAKYWIGKSGITIPPAVLANADLTSRYAKAALLGEQFYKNDPDQGALFVQGYVQGGPAQGFQMAGPPRANPKVTLRDIQVGDQRQIARFDQSGRMLGTVTGADGNPVQSATGQNGLSSQDSSVKLRDYKALIPQLGEELARATVYGQNGLTPGERYVRAAVEAAGKNGIPVTDEYLQGLKEQAINLNKKFGSQAPAGVPLPAPTGGAMAPAPEGLDVQQPAPQRASATAADGTTYYSSDNGATWVDGDGHPYVEPGPDAQPGLYQ